MDSMITSSYLAVAFIGLIHGLEPGHGWPLAALMSVRRGRPIPYGIAASMILASAHFVSSLAVLLVYCLASAFIDFASPYFRYVVAAVLIIIAIRMFMEKTDQESLEKKNGIVGLKGLAAFALVLGFAHEEEFMLLALAVGGVDPLVMMITYASAVTASLICVTVFAIKAYSVAEHRVRGIERYLPKITGAVLLVLAFLFLLGVY